MGAKERGEFTVYKKRAYFGHPRPTTEFKGVSFQRFTGPAHMVELTAMATGLPAQFFVVHSPRHTISSGQDDE